MFIFQTKMIKILWIDEIFDLLSLFCNIGNELDQK